MKYISIAILFLASSLHAQTLRQNGLSPVTDTLTASTSSITNCLRVPADGSSLIAGPCNGGGVSAPTVKSTVTIQGNAFSVGTSTLAVSSGRLGVGTASPGTTLDVNGDATVRGQETVTTTVTVQGNALSVGVSSFVVTGSSVGIRAASPGSALDVGGDATIRDQETVTSSMTVGGDAISGIESRSGDDNTYFGLKLMQGNAPTTGFGFGVDQVGSGLVLRGGSNLSGSSPILMTWDRGSTAVSVSSMVVGGSLTTLSSMTVQNAIAFTTATASGAIGHFSRTKAQLLIIAPAVGQTFYCSNCSPPKIVVGTGTAAGNFADAVGSEFK